MINNPATVSHKESLPVSPLSPEQPGVIMMCQHIWPERLTASTPNRASSGQRSPGRPPIFSSSCSPPHSGDSAVILNRHITAGGDRSQSVRFVSTMCCMCLFLLCNTTMCINTPSLYWVVFDFSLLIALFSNINSVPGRWNLALRLLQSLGNVGYFFAITYVNYRLGNK